MQKRAQNSMTEEEAEAQIKIFMKQLYKKHGIERKKILKIFTKESIEDQFNFFIETILEKNIIVEEPKSQFGIPSSPKTKP
jgi:hypothetical protein